MLLLWRCNRGMNMKKKTLEYVLGMITGISIMIAMYACTSPLQATIGDIGASELNPLYVKIVD